MSNDLPGAINGPMVGIVMRELVRRVIENAQMQRFCFETINKDNPYKSGQDIVTSVDLAAQAIYVKLLRECFPTWGIVAEEQGLRIDNSDGDDIWFTVDPVDGTKALARGQSHGISTMLSLVANGQVIAAVIGDISTDETYYHRPGSQTVHRLTRPTSEQ